VTTDERNAERELRLLRERVESILRDSMNQYDKIPWWAAKELRAAIGKPYPERLR
jgi:uncharacterized protein with HEPN domain